MPLLGRDPLLAELSAAVDQAAGGAGSVVAILGEAGIGKTLLLEELARRVADRARVLQAGCEALFTPRPLGPLYDIARRDAGDVDSLQRSIGILEHLGDGSLIHIVRQKLRAHGVRGPHKSTRANPAGLTAREMEILQLLDEGLRNADIAARLHVSAKTVGHLVSSVLPKLGVRTRGRRRASTARKNRDSPDSRRAAGTDTEDHVTWVHS